MDAWRVDELSEAEKRAIAALPREQAPRPELEEAIVGELRRRGALRRGGSQRWWKLLAAAAAAVAIFAGGAIYGRTPVPQAHWILLLHEGREDRSVPPEEAQRRVQEYASWARANAANGLIDGEELAEGGSHFSGTAERPLVRTTDSIAGYFLLGAVDVLKARAIALSCPHLSYGGEIEVRRIETASGDSADTYIYNLDDSHRATGR